MSAASLTASDCEELCRMDLHSVSALLETGQANSEELVVASLGAIGRHQPVVNAFLSVDPEGALAAARHADSERAAGRVLGPLHGVPLAHKDIFFRPGRKTTAGSAFAVDPSGADTATVLQGMDAAGAVDMGTLNLAEFCVGPTGQNDHTGHCRNPWDPERISGGSSSGSGAAVAARMVYGSIGSDTGGSIRIPAALCGVTGLKPSYGRISLHGAVQRCWSLDVFGPIARSARDVALMFDAIDSFDPRDTHSVAGQERNLSLPVAGRPRIAVPHGVLESLPGWLAAIHHDALAALVDAGAIIVAVATPDTERLYQATTVINNVEATWLHRERLAEAPERFNGSTLSRINRGGAVTALAYLDAINGRSAERLRFEAQYLAAADAMYLPMMGIDTPLLSDVEFSDTQGADAIVPKITQWTRFVSYLGLPAISMPIGLSPAGMPVAAQLIGAYFHDRALLDIARQYQDGTSWHTMEPSHAG